MSSMTASSSSKAPLESVVSSTQATPDSNASASTQAAALDQAKPTGLVMQIILRRDLVTSLGWPLGPMMAQAAHAASAVQHRYADHVDMKRYLSGEDGRGWEVMRKAVLEVPDEAALQNLAAKLEAAGIPHHVWMEEPEHYPTALALVPNKRPKGLKRILDESGCSLWK
ncbi:uncharacterized protein EHS24_005141 [Apiotrichum porosum]|uniref:peptidyl-tRNA hydrolase n=1 Tax=Apiotrichum porosum TaxID=105984 RepID=A0A427Y6Z3_9TREE|nr:uncharacterized protein EHS24_005141 [Apiotrichum porosum]RSH86863.1 hypothetical protein EHS24_005141 [Apiotrichum porosum]